MDAAKEPRESRGDLGRRGGGHGMHHADKMSEEMHEVSETIERFNKGEIELDATELSELMDKRDKLLKEYYKIYFPENVFPLIPRA